VGRHPTTISMLQCKRTDENKKVTPGPVRLLLGTEGALCWRAADRRDSSYHSSRPSPRRPSRVQG
jgi:hypothetical protein